MAAESRRLSLGHKQLEENPWDVYESLFTVGSVHQGKIVNMNDKGATVMLPYDVEAFAPMRHLDKEDKSKARQGETLDFKVIEFGKDSKRIVVSHTRTFQDGSDAVREGDEKKGGRSNTAKSVKQINESLEKTTLGDLDILQKLKEENS